MKKAVCLLSGGLDSATACYSARRTGYEIIALTINYHQVHEKEIESATRIAAVLGIQHYIISLPMPWGGSALTDSKIAIPLNRKESDMNKDIPVTYVPARNTVFLSMAASCAEASGAVSIFIGANALDYSGYPDCRPDFFEAFQKTIALGTKVGIEGHSIKIEAPLLRMSKKEIIFFGKELGVPFELTWSCYQGKARACGQCDSCILRAKGFEEAGLKDPLLNYESSANH